MYRHGGTGPRETRRCSAGLDAALLRPTERTPRGADRFAVAFDYRTRWRLHTRLRGSRSSGGGRPKAADEHSEKYTGAYVSSCIHVSFSVR